MYWVSIGHYEAVAVGNWRYWVSRGHFCLYILNKVEIWTGVTDALLLTLTDWLTHFEHQSYSNPLYECVQFNFNYLLVVSVSLVMVHQISDMLKTCIFWNRGRKKHIFTHVHEQNSWSREGRNICKRIALFSAPSWVLQYAFPPLCPIHRASLNNEKKDKYNCVTLPIKYFSIKFSPKYCRLFKCFHQSLCCNVSASSETNCFVKNA